MFPSRFSSFSSFFGIVFVSSALGLAACGPSAETTDLRAAAEDSVADGGSSGSTADETEIVHGVPDRNQDPAVVALSIGNQALCTASLVSPRIILTARHCVSRTVESVGCPPSSVQILSDYDPSSLEVLVGDDVASAHAVAHGTSIVTPGGVTLCDADIALVILDKDVKTAKPMPIRTKGVNKGDHVRAVGFGMSSNRDFVAGVKLVREHVPVLSVSAAEFTVGEATCQGDSGGPAIDESTGEIVGVVSRGGPSCEGKNVHNIYTRVDTFSWLIDEAFAKVAGLPHDGDADAGAPSTPPAKGTKSTPPTDTGTPCETGNDCAAGICLTTGDVHYCSRPCGTGDRCPNGYHCQKVNASQACVSVK